VDLLLQRIELISGRMFPLGEKPNYEPALADSFLVRAKRSGQPAVAALYDYLCEGDGSNLIYFPIFNYNGGSLEVVRRMLEHPRALAGLSDAGAHVGTVCDASFPTFLLTWWARDRERDRLPLERVVELLTSRNARYLGLSDRGVIAPGMRADLNVVDPSRLALRRPELRRDLPAGGKRFVQTAEGYVATFVAGRAVQRDGLLTNERPGRLVRLGSQSSVPSAPSR
jgi:N-acyl-D-aspartate/D-glutamate deacylase